MAVPIEIGMIVRMKSGGPRMTIERSSVVPPWYVLNKKKTVECVWFDPDNVIKRALFDPQTLVAGIPKKD